MKKTILLLAVLGITGTISAQTDLVELVRSDLRTDNKALVMANVPMSETQSTIFWPIYNDYSDALRKIWDERITIIKDYAARIDNMDDETASKLMSRKWANDGKILSLKKGFQKKFNKVLPPALVSRFFQVQDRIEGAIELQLADAIPLMPVKK